MGGGVAGQDEQGAQDGAAVAGEGGGGGGADQEPEGEPEAGGHSQGMGEKQVGKGLAVQGLKTMIIDHSERKLNECQIMSGHQNYIIGTCFM